jgi:hydrogenase-4 component E
VIDFFVLLFAFSLIFLSITERFRSYANLICLQGVLLFLVSFVLLKELDWANLLFITAETLLFKAVITPRLLYRIIVRTGVSRAHKSALPIFPQLLLTMLALLVGVGISFMLKDAQAINHSFLAISISTLLCGLLFIITHRRIFSHMIGFLVIENAVFLFSMAAGTEMPILINTGILIDLIITTLILSTFLTKLNESNPELEADSLTQLKD